MLILVRESAGLTQSALAAHGGISQALESRIENGFEEPSAPFLEKSAVGCGVPVEFFEQQDLVLGDTVFDIYHKKRLTLPQKPLKQADANVKRLRMEVGCLFRSLDVPATRPFPTLSLGMHEGIGEVAALTRATWQMPQGPIPNLVEAIESTGTPVLSADLGHEKLRAISLPGVKSGNPHIIALNNRLPASAQRFALAHEIGHLVMHDGTGSDNMEKEADEFASAFLMPEAVITPQLRNLQFRDLGELKRQWHVSLAALIFRAHALGLTSDRHNRTLNMQLSQLPNGRKREPGEFEPEKPTLVRNAIDAYRDHGYSVDELCELMVITRQRFREQYDPDAPLADDETPRFRVIG